MTDYESIKSIAIQIEGEEAAPERLAEVEQILTNAPEVLAFFVRLFSLQEDARNETIQWILAHGKKEARK